MRIPAADRPCIEPGCLEKRHVVPSLTLPRCWPHQQAFNKDHYLNPPIHMLAADRPCAESGCIASRHRGPNGRVFSRCLPHINARSRVHAQDPEVKFRRKALQQTPEYKALPCTEPGCLEPRYVFPGGRVSVKCWPHYRGASIVNTTANKAAHRATRSNLPCVESGCLKPRYVYGRAVGIRCLPHIQAIKRASKMLREQRRKARKAGVEVTFHLTTTWCCLCGDALDPTAGYLDPMYTEGGHEPPCAWFPEEAPLPGEEPRWQVLRLEHAGCNRAKHVYLDEDLWMPPQLDNLVVPAAQVARAWLRG